VSLEPAWLVALALYWGMGFGLLGGMYANDDAPPPTGLDWAMMLTVGPFVMLWVCAARFLRTRQR
jgi:hypothetical protein